MEQLAGAHEPARRLQTASVPVACFLTAVAVTTGFFLPLSWYDEQRVLSLLLSAAVLGIATRSAVLEHLIWRPGVSAILLFFFLGVACAALAARPHLALLEVGQFAAIAVSALTVVRGDREARFAVLSLALVIPAFYIAAVAARYVSALLVGMPIGGDTLVVGFANPRFPAQLQAMTLPFMPVLLAGFSNRWVRAVVALIAGLWWTALIGSGSRSAWLALVIGVLLIALAVRGGREWLKVHLGLALFGAILYVALFIALPAAFSVSVSLESGRIVASASIEARLALWTIAADLVRSNLLLGVGPMHFAFVNNGLGAHPHNVWLQLAAEWGLPAALLGAGLMIGLWRRLFLAARAVSGDAALVRTASLAALTSLVVGSMTDGYFVIPTSQIVAALVLSVAVALAVPGSDVVVAGSGRTLWQTACWRGLLLVCLASIVALAFSPFGRPTEREQHWRVAHGGEWLWPRFWQLGWIGLETQEPVRAGQDGGRTRGNP